MLPCFRLCQATWHALEPCLLLPVDQSPSISVYIGFLFLVQLSQVPLGAAELHRHPRDGHPRPPEAAEANDLVLPVLQTGDRGSTIVALGQGRVSRLGRWP